MYYNSHLHFFLLVITCNLLTLVLTIQHQFIYRHQTFERFKVCRVCRLIMRGIFSAVSIQCYIKKKAQRNLIFIVMQLFHTKITKGTCECRSKIIFGTSLIKVTKLHHDGYMKLFNVYQLLAIINHDKHRVIINLEIIQSLKQR